MAPATHGLLGRILRANDDASRRYGDNTAEVDAFIHAASQLSPWQWRQVLTARRLVSTVTKEDAAPAPAALQQVQAAIRSTDGKVSETMSRAGEALFEALDKRSDEKVATAWQALSALVMREQLSPLKFAVHYAPFISLIPVSGFDGLDPDTMRFLGAVEGLTKERCELLARRWRLDAEASRGLLKVVARSRYLKAEEAAALLALRTVPTYLQGDAGWAAVKTLVHGGRVLGARTDMPKEQVAVLWAPLEAAIPLASVEEPVAKPVRARVRAAVARAATAITKPPPSTPVAKATAPPKRAAATKPPAPYGPNSSEVAQFIKSVVELTPIQWLRVIDRRNLVASVTRQDAEPAGVVRSLLATIKGTKSLDTFSRCRAFAAVERASGTVAAKGQLTYEESMKGYGAFGEIVQLDYVDADGFAKLVAALNTSDWVKVADSIPAVNQDVVAPLVNAGGALHDFLEGRTDEEAAALAAVVTVPMRVSGSEGWAAAKTAAFGGRVIGSRSRLSLEQLEVLWKPIQPAIPLASLGAITKSRR